MSAQINPIVAGTTAESLTILSEAVLQLQTGAGSSVKQLRSSLWASQAQQTLTRKNAPAFVDSLAVSPIAAYGFTRMRSAYAGNCCLVRRESDSATLAIPFGADNIVDTALMQAFAGASTLRMVTMYDQIGANNATQAAAGSQPIIDFSVLQNGIPSMSCDGPGWLTIPAGVAITSRANCSIWSVQGLISNRLSTPLWDLGATTLDFALNATPTSAFSVQPIISGTYQTFGTMATLPVSTPSVVGLNSSVGGADLYTGAVKTSKAAFAAAAIAGGSLPSASGSSVENYAFLVFNASLAASDISLVQYGLAASYSASNSYDASVVLQGDSITAGAIGKGINFRRMLAQHLPPNVSIYSFGKGGDFLSGHVAEAASYIDPMFKSGKSNVAVILSGVNDIQYGAATDTALKASLTTWATARKAAGFKVVAGTLFSRNVSGGYTALMETYRVAYNTWLREQVGTLIDAVADFDTDPSLVPIAVGDFPDNLHPNLAGYKKATPILAAAISSLLPTV